MTAGEALNYTGFIGPPWTEALGHFDANNHVLNTLLVRISTSRFHLTELSLRLPSLLAGVFYLWAVFRMARRRFGDGMMFLFVTALLTLNPVIVDAMSEARGYGMALACWMWALELILESVESFSAQKLNLAGLCLGLSVAASLAFAAPAAALLAVYLFWSRTGGNGRTGGRPPGAHRWARRVSAVGYSAESGGVEDARGGSYQSAANHQSSHGFIVGNFT